MELTAEQLKRTMDDGERFAEMICKQVHTDAQKAEWAKTIKNFNALYYQASVQTWSNTKWRGIPVLKPPTDMWVYQELICKLKPDLIIETGTWAGGSALFMRDVMKMDNQSGVVISIDLDWRKIAEGMHHIPGMRLWNKDCIDPETINDLKTIIRVEKRNKVMVILDSEHTKEHVLRELELYAPLVTKGMPLIVEDGNNCSSVKEAIDEWFPYHLSEFKADYMCEKFMLTFNRDGFFERV